MRRLIASKPAAGPSRNAAQAAQDGCPPGSYSVVVAPDHSTLSILFDQFQLDSSAATAAATRSKVCSIAYPLNLPANMSLGVYKVDYRGFAKLVPGQQAALEVQYGLAPHANQHGRVFKRKVRGAHDGDYFFTENIGAGQMKRVAAAPPPTSTSGSNSRSAALVKA